LQLAHPLKCGRVMSDSGLPIASYMALPPPRPLTHAGFAADCGPVVAQSLLQECIDESFAALKAYVTEYSYRNVATEDFRAVCERFYGKSLDWFFAQWIYGVSRPTYRVSWAAADDQLAVTIRQVQTDAGAFRMPIDVLVTTAAGATRHIVWNDRSEQIFEIPMGRRVTDADMTNVSIDPDDWILKGQP
jgi:hypothetical protein